MTGPDPDGVAIVGRELSRDGEIGDPVGVPVDRLTRHLMIAGTTGSGKTTTATSTISTASQHTDGATIVINPKSNDWGAELARAEYYHRGTLDDVLYFDAMELIPAISFFDIRPLVDAGVPRRRAVNAVADHFIDILDQVMEKGINAVRAPDVIRYVVTALFDPIHGSDHYSISELSEAIYALRRDRRVPEVSAEWEAQLLESLQDGTENMFQTILQGSVTRVEKITGSGYLRPLFDFSPDDPADAFDFGDWINQDCTIILDIGDIPKRGQQILATTFISLIWRAVQQRSFNSDRHADHATALLALEELAKLDVAEQLTELLSLGREYGLGVLAMLQFPGQLREQDPIVYQELLEEIHSLVIGRIQTDDLLVDRLSSSSMSTSVVERRLRKMAHSRWLFQPAEARDARPIPTHTIFEPPLPPGHPDGPLKIPDEFAAFDSVFADRKAYVRRHHAVQYESFDTPDRPPSIDSSTGPASLDADEWDDLVASNFRTTAPLVDELPPTVHFDVDRVGFVCKECGGIQPDNFTGLVNAIMCHGSLDALTRADLFPVALNLGLSVDEILAAPVSPKELIALQLLINMFNGRYECVEYDHVLDAAHDILDRFGIGRETRLALDDAGYLAHDRVKGFVFPSVTPKARDLLNVTHRRGLDWGDGEGDLNEHLLHVSLVDGLARYAEQTVVDDPASPIVEIRRYHEIDAETAAAHGLDERVRLDVAGLDADQRIRLIAEAEIDNHDQNVAAIHDYDQIAALEPDHAIWAVPTSARGHDAVLQPLANPPEDHPDIQDATPRIKHYAESTRIESIAGIDAPGLTDIFTLSELRNELDEPSPSDLL